MKRLQTAAFVLVLTAAFAAAATAGCWTGNGYSDATTNFVEAQVWPGDADGLGTSTYMLFFYTLDGSDPYASSTYIDGVFYQYSGNNDWYQATIPASNGDTVRWFARSMSADGEECDSEEYGFVSGVAVEELPNLVGDLESELGLGGDWLNNDEASKLHDGDADGIYSVALTATADFIASGGAGYQIVAVSGNWNPQYPGDSNVPTSFTVGATVEFFLDTNAMTGWAPESNAAYDDVLLGAGNTWAAVGDWQGWNPAEPTTQMADMGDGTFYLAVPFDETMLGTYQFKCAANGGWDLQAGVNGYGSNSSTWQFDVTEPRVVEFWLHESGRIKVVVTDTVENENMSFGTLKANYR